MLYRSGRHAPGARAKHWHPFDWLRRSFRRMWELYRNCLEATPLLRAWLPRKVAQPPTVSNVSFIHRRGTRRSEITSSAQSGVGLAVASTVAALVVTGYWYTIEFGILAQEHVYITGATEGIAALPDGSEVSLSAHSTLTVDDTGPQRVAFLQAGEIVFKVRATATRPFILQTIRATATVIADATFRVAIGADIEFEIFDGVVKVALRGAKADAPARWLRKGDSLRVPVHGIRPVLADCRGSVSASAAG